MIPQIPSSFQKQPDLIPDLIDIESGIDPAQRNIGEDQMELFRQAMEEARRQIEKIDTEMLAEIARTREMLMRLQATKKRYLCIFQDAAQILGIPALEG